MLTPIGGFGNDRLVGIHGGRNRLIAGTNGGFALSHGLRCLQHLLAELHNCQIAGAQPLFRDERPLALTLTYTSALGGGSGNVPVTLAASEQKVLPDVMAFLRDSGLAIPAGGANVAGSLLVKVPAGRAADLLAAGARVSTRSSVRDGAFGVFYPGLTLFESANGTAWVHGLQQDSRTRSNVAVVNFGDAGNVTLRLTFYGATGQALGSPEEHVLAPGAWLQRNEPLSSRGASAGSVKIERISGTSRFVAYGVLNDAATSDGSYLPMAR